MVSTTPPVNAASPPRRVNRLWYFALALAMVIGLTFFISWLGRQGHLLYPGRVAVAPKTVVGGDSFQVTITLPQAAEAAWRPDELIVWGVIATPGEAQPSYPIQLGHLKRVSDTVYSGTVSSDSLPPGTHAIQVFRDGASSATLGQGNITVIR